ncbi:MAG TPA: MMPL family transporter [Sandaracinaceae bacterium LLY-WYZ-13_1]|nr:MMPL family transporter [Sandaracinaceae bacterium LLY-WYZ-13_1]
MDAGKEPPRRRPGLPERLADMQHDRPWRVVILSFVLGIAALPLIVGIPGHFDGLTLNSDFTAMLPESAQSVRDLDEIQERFGGQQALNIVVESEDTEQLHAFVRELAPRIEAMEEHDVAAVDWNLSDFREFVEDNRHLYADLEDLQSIRDALDARLEHERAQANPFYIDLSDEEPPDPRETLERIERDAEAARSDLDERFPDGFLQHPERSLVLIVVHTRIRGGDTRGTEQLIAAIDEAVQGVDPDAYASDLEIHYGGTLMEVRDETESLVAAVRDATLLTVALVMVAIYVFFLRVRPIPLLSLALIPPVLLTFGVAELTVDYLNASSAFLSSIVVGNGINPNVIWLARYFELRREGVPVREALVRSHRGTWKGTLTASLAAGVAYGSLISTDYRGFRDFGIVGGTGMVLCWLAAYLLLPALTTVFERLRPLKFEKRRRHKGFYGVLFAKLALGRPRAVLVGSLLLTLVSGGLVAWAIADDPLEYDYRRLRSERDPGSDVEYVLEASRPILDDTMSGSALAVLAPSREEARRFRRHLEENRDEMPNAYGEVESVDLLLPEDQDDKLPVVRELRQLMLDIRPHVDEDMQETIDEQLPPEEVSRLEPEDLPRSVARPFTERDGTRGRLLFLEHHPEESGWDGRYTQRWAEAARSLRAEGASEPPPVAGTAVVFSDLMHQIWSDGPRAIGIAFLATVLLLGFTFRRHRERSLTLASLLVGILWMAGTMAAFGMRLNFLNFVAFPITFGNGADYGVNVMRRVAAEEDDGERSPLRAIRAAVEGTGGAVILCSLTTVIGYISIYTSSNRALNSFGAAMAISEVTCLFAAVVALPAALYLWSRRGRGAPEGDWREVKGAEDARSSEV